MRPAIHEDLHASDVREWQLWLLTLGVLLCVGSAAIASAFFVADAYVGDSDTRALVFRLLTGLALLIVLFAAYVVQARTHVGRVKLFLNEMSGMATGNLEVKDCLHALARGMALTYRSPMCRILIQRSTDAALEIVSTWGIDRGSDELRDGLAHGLDELPILRQALEARRPALLDVDDLEASGSTPTERAILTGPLPAVCRVLVLPLYTAHGKTGVIVVGLGRRIGTPRANRPLVATAEVLARHAATVIDEAMRRREAVRDPLTDLYNRRHFERRVREEIERAARERHTLAILLCDLDGFKQVNDTKGHPFGDQVLKAVASTLRRATRGTDLHFRWGGDEMVVILSKTSEEGALIAAERIREGVRAYARDQKFELDISIGIAIYPAHGAGEAELVRVADLAMYVAKTTGDRIRIGYEEYAVNEQCVTFVFQPIWHVDSETIVGHEVFVRDPGGTLSPSDLFQKYRAVGQLRRLQRMILEMQIRRAHEAGVRRLFLNTDLEFLPGMDPPVIPTGLEIVVELSEADSGSSVDRRLAVAQRWRQVGYRIALDDFGAGYESLTVLARLLPDYIKVDRSCLVHAAGSDTYREFLKHLLRGAAVFTSAGIIAEGIEQPSDLALLRELGIPLAQGFLLGRPEAQLRIAQERLAAARPGSVPGK